MTPAEPATAFETREASSLASKLYQFMSKRLGLLDLEPGSIEYWRRSSLAVCIAATVATIVPAALLGGVLGLSMGDRTIGIINCSLAIGLAAAALIPNLTVTTRLTICVGSLMIGTWALAFTDAVAASSHVTAMICTPVFVALVAGRRSAEVVVAANLVFATGIGIQLARHLPSSWPSPEFDQRAWVMTSMTSNAIGLGLALTIDHVVGQGLGPALEGARARSTRLLDANKKLEVLAEDLEFRREELKKMLWASSHTMVEPVKLANNYALLLSENLGQVERDQFNRRLLKQLRNLNRVVTSFRRYLSVDDSLDDMEPAPIADAVRFLQLSLPSLGFPHEQWMETSTVGLNRDSLVQVLVEPITNAIRHNETRPNISIESYRLDDTWHLEISDDGKGLTPGLAAVVFDPFRNAPESADGPRPDTGTTMTAAAVSTSTSTEGQVGLAMAQKIVKLVRGSIELESSPYQKTSVRISLPVKQLPPRAQISRETRMSHEPESEPTQHDEQPIS